MASWKDTIKNDDGSAPVAGASWKDSIQDESSLMDQISQGASNFVNAPSPLGPSLKESAQTAEDFGIGAAQGLTMGAADEIGGGISALLEKGASYIPGTDAHNTKQVNEQLAAQGFQVPEESILDTYRDYQKGSEQAFKASNERSPVANTLGNIGGSITTGIGLGNALGIGNQAKNSKSIYDVYKSEGKLNAAADLLKKAGTTYAKAAPAMAAESALVSEGNLDNEESRSKLGKDVLSGLGYGIPAILGVEGATGLVAPAAKATINSIDDKFGKFVESSPFLRKYAIGMKHAENGTKPTTEAGLNALESQQIDRTRGMLDNVYAADETLGKAVGKSIDDATSTGARLDIEKPVTKALKALDFSYSTFQDMSENARGRKIFEKIQKNMNGDVSPREAKDLLDDIDSFRTRFDAIRAPNSTELAIKESLAKVRKELSDQMKKDIPSYGQAAERFHEFRNLIPETILSKERPADVTNIFMGNLKNSDQKLYDALNELQMGATAQGSGAANSRKAFGNVQAGMKEFETNEATRNAALQAQGLPTNVNPLVQSADDFTKQTKQFSDEANFLRDIQTVKSPVINDVKQVASNLGGLGRSTLGTSLLVGRVKKPLVDMSKKAYNLPAEQLNNLAQKMQQAPGLKILGKALADGLANGDQAKKNAAIFSILQNPEARLLIDDEKE